MLRRSRYRPAARRREACQPTRPRRVARRDYIQRPSRVCRKTYAERSVGVRRKAPGAHAESQQMSTGRTRVRGVTTHSAEQRRRGKTVTAAGGQRKGAVLRRREGVEGACIGDAPRLSRRVGRSPDVGGRVPEDGCSTDGILRSAQDDSIPVILRPSGRRIPDVGGRVSEE